MTIGSSIVPLQLMYPVDRKNIQNILHQLALVKRFSHVARKFWMMWPSMEEKRPYRRLTIMSIKQNASLTVVSVFLVASCNTGEGKVGNSQQGAFVTRRGSRITLPTKQSNVAVADLNEDGQLDLIVASEEPRAVTVLLGDRADAPFRAATARTIALPESPGDMVLGDVNGDDRLDVVLDSHDS